MLHEPASSFNDRPIPRPLDEVRPATRDKPKEPRSISEDRATKVRELVDTVFDVEVERIPTTQTKELSEVELAVISGDSRLVLSYRGRFTVDSEAAYNLLDSELAPMNLLPIFREQDQWQFIHIVEGRVEPQPRSWLPNVILLLLTLGSVLFVGTMMSINDLFATGNQLDALRVIENPFRELWRGLPYATSILLILGAHELGHYFAARHHKIAVTLPYFLPAPFGLFGTFGAFIQLRQPMRNRKVLLDVGAAGPLAGLVFAIPILFIGLATSTVDMAGTGLVEGNSLLYALAKTLTFGEFLPNGVQDVYVNQMAWAGWTGLFVTGLNLIPIGQLDGGHVLYAVIGDRARLMYYPAIIVMLFLTVLSQGALVILLLLLVFLGRVYATPLDNITPLDNRRRWIALLTLVIFIAVFVPIPLTESAGVTVDPSLVPGGNSAMLPSLIGLWLVMQHRIGEWVWRLTQPRR